LTNSGRNDERCGGARAIQLDAFGDGMSTAIAFQLLVAGLSTGSIYALVALGLVLAFKATGILNFAHGEFVTLGAYLGLFAGYYFALTYWPALLAAVLLCGFAGLLMERSVVRPLITAPPFTVVIATLAVGLSIKNVLRVSWQENLSTIPGTMSQTPIAVGSLSVNPQYLIVIAITFVLLGVLASFFKFSWLGIAMRAVSEDQRSARLAGINVERVLMFTFAISGGVAALAGLLLAPLTGVNIEMGWIIVKALVAAVLGGFNSLPGAVAGGLLLGLAEAFCGLFLDGVTRDFGVFGLLILALLVRPHGLFGLSQARRV
jgi:branched-chain amino acid transport system permease protein